MSQEETENLNRLITTNETEAVIKKSLSKQKSWARWLHRQILPHIQRTNTYLSQTIPNIQEGRSSSSFYDAGILLTPKSGKDTTKKENYRSISLVNIDAKILNKILANLIQQCIKKIINNDQLGFILGI